MTTASEPNNFCDLDILNKRLREASDLEAWRNAVTALGVLIRNHKIIQDEPHNQIPIAEIMEALGRLENYSQAKISLPSFLNEKVKAGAMTEHEAYVATIEHQSNFHACIYHRLVTLGAVNPGNMESTVETADDVDEFVRKQMAQTAHLQAVIIEIYCAGNVTFSPDALPPDLYKMVTTEMKVRGKLMRR